MRSMPAIALFKARVGCRCASVSMPMPSPPQSSDAEANSGLDDIRADLGPEHYLAWARLWHARGATIIGGCCGIGPEHIAVLDQARQAFAGGLQ